MLGAEEYGIGTAALIAMGCIMVRQCQSNTCPVGVCTQNEELREKFTGSADKVVNLITFYAQEVREILASIGARSMGDVIGRADLLSQVSRGSAHLDDLDLNPLLITVDGADQISYDQSKPRNSVPDTLDSQILVDAKRFLMEGEKMQLQYAVQNTSRTIGTRISSHIVTKFGMDNDLQDDHLTVKLQGAAGQALGAFAAPGLKLEVSGEANDYVGKGLSGGIIVVSPPQISPLVASENTIIGNTVLYGATNGYLFAAGRAGERFGVRNSGAKTVIEGCGSNGCEYMTGGVAVILGPVGANFGAGMTGGMAYLYDPKRSSGPMMNMETLITCKVTVEHWEQELKVMVQRHLDETASIKAADILQNWGQEIKNFVQVCPKEMLIHLPEPLAIETTQSVPAE
jgi:glutamate synthase (NADPH/NADH) large chain